MLAATFQMVLGLLSHAASVAIGALYPAFKTFKVIREGNYSLMVLYFILFLFCK